MFWIEEVIFFSLCFALTATVARLSGSSEWQRTRQGIHKHLTVPRTWQIDLSSLIAWTFVRLTISSYNLQDAENVQTVKLYRYFSALSLRFLIHRTRASRTSEVFVNAAIHLKHIYIFYLLLTHINGEHTQGQWSDGMKTGIFISIDFFGTADRCFSFGCEEHNDVDERRKPFGVRLAHGIDIMQQPPGWRRLTSKVPRGALASVFSHGAKWKEKKKTEKLRDLQRGGSRAA